MSKIDGVDVLAPKWEVFTDEQGNMYFCNAVTGESVWELPPEEEHDDAPAFTTDGHEEASAKLCVLAFDPAAATPSALQARHKDEFSEFEIAIGVIDAMLMVLDTLEVANILSKPRKKKKFVSPAAEARFKKNQANDEKKKKRLREKLMATYLRIVIPLHAADSTAGDGHEPHDQASPPQKAGLSNVGALFTLEDTIRWRLEREVAQIKQRRVIRKEKQQHQKRVFSLKRQQEMLKSFRTELTRYFLSQIEYSTELQQQRILLLSSPQQVAEMEARRQKTMEPEIAERYTKKQQAASVDNRKNIQKVFVLIDEAGKGKVHLLQILFGIFTLERAQQYALKVRGLSELINSQEIQKFVIDFVSSAHDRDFTVTMDEFAGFVAIIEDVLSHFTSVKAAVEEAEDEIDATLEATASKPGTSLVRARLGIVSKKKIEQEIAALRATEDQIRLCHEQEQQEAFRSDEGFALAPKEVWEKNHHHRFIRFSESLPLYCCLCRRRKWEIERREHEEHESIHRSNSAARFALKVKQEELKLVEKDELPQAIDDSISATEDRRSEASLSAAISSVMDNADTIASDPFLLGATKEDTIVFQVVRSLVSLTERLMSHDPDREAKSPKRTRTHKKGDKVNPTSPTRKTKKLKDKQLKTSIGEADAKLQLAMKVFEGEESERKAMHVEEVRMLLLLEKNRRALERPLLQVQDAAYNSYIRMLSHIVNPNSFLYRLQFLQCLRFTPPQQLALQMLDRSENTRSDGSSTNSFILQSVACRNETEGSYMIKQLKFMEEKLRSPFVAKVVSVSKHTFQFFADSGMLVECWPVLFIATEYFDEGSWLQHFRKHFLEDSGRSFADVEQHLFATFRQVAAGLASMHSLGVLHLNLNLDNIYVSACGEEDSSRLHVRIAGFLSCKVAFTDEQLKSGGMQSCINYCIAPPETLKENQQVTAKADVWMLGCALYEALVSWQKQQLQAYNTSRSDELLEEDDNVVVHLKSIQDILQEIPISASSVMRSLLRMLLQPNPAQRPLMSQIIDFLSFAGKQGLWTDQREVAVMMTSPGEAGAHQKVTLKELFQAAQQDDFQTVKDYLQIVLHRDGDDEASSPSKEDQQAVTKALIEAKTKNTLLHYACDNGNLDACKYLLMLNGVAENFLNEPNAFGHTPLFYASSNGKLPLVKWLISNGADIDTDYSDHRDIVPREGDQGIFTPLQIACFKGHEDIVNFLVECNAELSGTRRNGKTPLHFASLQSHRGVVKILLEAGADVHACDDQGKTPIDLADASMLATLLPDEHAGGDNDDDIEVAADADDEDDDDDEDDSPGARERRSALESVKNAFGNAISRGFRSKTWKSRVNAISEASLCFQSVTNGKAAIKLFDGACQMLLLGFQDAVSQVVSCCCSSLLKAAFNAVMSEKEFHTLQFHQDRPVIHEIANALLNRGAGSNEKDASEAVASLLYLICKSMDLTRYLTTQISQIMSTTPANTFASPSKTTESSASASGSVSWRHQLVSIKILNTIASQYRLDQASSGLNLADALKLSITALENSSVHVRTAAIDLLVQCLLIRCEQSEMSGSVDEIYEQMKSWGESIFKQQNQSLKPSIQAKINNGLKNALQSSKRLNSLPSTENGQERTAGPKASSSTMFDVLTPAMSPRAKSAQKEDDLPYAEPIQDQNKDDAVEILACFGEKVARCLFSNAWAPRVEALSFLQNQVDTRQLTFDSKSLTGGCQSVLLRAIQRTLLQALQDRVNSVFEAGVSLLMEVAIAFDGAVANDHDRSNLQDLMRPLIPRLLVKLGDSKSRLHVTTEDALLLLSRQSNSIGPEFLLEEMIACDRSASPQTLSAVYLANKLGLISKLLLEFGVQESSTGEVGSLPIRSVLQPALQVCEHKDQNVRQVSLQIVADTLQVARTATMPFLDALARASRQKLISKLVEKGVLEADLLMDEVDDFDAEPSRPGTSGGIRPPTASGSSTKHRPALSNTSLSASSSSAAQASAAQSQSAALPYGAALTSDQKEQYAGIINGLGEELVRCLLDKTWPQREAAVREIERQVICTANGKTPADKALPKTIESLRVMAMALELGLNDTVARVFQCSLRLFQIIATDFVPLVTSTHEYVDAILENVVGLVMQKLGDTKQRLRSDCFTLLHSLASLSHISHARMCKMLVDKYQQLVSSSSATASSPLLAGELLKLFTLLIKEAHTTNSPPSSAAARPDLASILDLIRPAFENKHVDVRNAAIATYAAIYEVTNGGSDESYGKGIDLNGFLAQTKPAIREAITKSVVQINKSLPQASSDEVSAPEVDSARQQSLALDVNKLTQICGSQIVTLLTSISSAARCQGVDKLMGAYLESPRHSNFKGAWEISCLLVKQLLLDGTPSVCLSAFELLEFLVDPPGNGVVCAEYAIPWGEWGVHLILGSTIRGVIQQTANESVRVRARAQSLLHVVAMKNSAGKSAVCNALLSAPEQSDLTSENSRRVKKIAVTKLRWQMMARLELLYDFMIGTNNDQAHSTSVARRKSSSGSSSKSLSEPLGVENVVPFLGSCATHPSASIREASLKIMGFLRGTRPEGLQKFIQDSCSAALQRRLRSLMSDSDDGDVNNADHFNTDDATCVRGNRSSHVRRIAALRPPRSVPAEESKMAVDVFPPPHSAPGKSRRSGDDGDDDSMNDGSYVVLHRGDRDESRGASSYSTSQQQVPIWLEQQSSRKGSSSLYGDGEPESAIGGGAAGLMKMRRKSSYRAGSNNGDDNNEDRRGSSTRYSNGVQGY